MKICDVVINSVWYDPRVRKQLIEYQEAGLDVVAVGLKCNRYDAEKVAQMPWKTSIAQIDPRFDRKQSGVLKKLIRTWLRYKAVRDAILAEKPDLIHANDLNALWPAFTAARKLKCKLIYDSHEVWAENNMFMKSPIKPVLRMAERYMVKRVNLMVCVSHAAAEYFSKLYCIPMPMVVTNCAMAKEIPVIGQTEKNSGFEVLNHGQFYAGRGYDIMVQACALLKEYPEVQLAIRGFGSMEEQLRNMVAELDNKEQFHFYPPVTVQELVPMAAKSHIGVAITESICLNFELSISNKIFEYISAGIPVIMSDIPEHRYLNKTYNFGLILPENTPRAFADAVIKLYKNPELYKELADNAKAMTKSVNWETEFARLIAAEKDILGGNH